MRYYLYQPLSGPGQTWGDCRMLDDRPKVVNVLTASRDGYLIFPVVRPGSCAVGRGLVGCIVRFRPTRTSSWALATGARWREYWVSSG